MFYKIVGSNKHELAYAEKLKSIKLLPDCRVYCEPFRGSCFFADVNEIIQDPEIIHEVAGGSLYKIRLVPAGGYTRKWIEERPNGWTYKLKCPCCGFCYSPKGYEDGTTDAPYKVCPNCGERFDQEGGAVRG